MKLVRSALFVMSAFAVPGSVALAAPPTSTPTASNDNAHVFVIGNVSVPGGAAPGTLEVVLQGPSDGSSVPLVVRNNTDQPVFNVSVEGIARGADGALLASGSSLEMEPSTLQPGEWALGYVYFDYDVLKGDETFMFQTSSDSDAGFLGDVPLAVSEATVNEGGFSLSVVGILLNETAGQVASPGVVIGCFDDAGGLLGVESGYGEADEVAAGGFTSFSADLYAVESCPNAAIAASGYDF